VPINLPPYEIRQQIFFSEVQGSLIHRRILKLVNQSVFFIDFYWINFLSTFQVKKIYFEVDFFRLAKE